MILNDNERRWFGFQVGYQPHVINFLHHNCPPANAFQKLCKPPQCLIRAVNRRFACIFLMSWAGRLQFSIQIWPHEENISRCPPRLKMDLLVQTSLLSWNLITDFALPNIIFKCRSTWLSWDGKQFITIEPIRIHTKDGRSHNGNPRYTIRPIEDAINYYHERQGLQH